MGGDGLRNLFFFFFLTMFGRIQESCFPLREIRNRGRLLDLSWKKKKTDVLENSFEEPVTKQKFESSFHVLIHL